MRIFFLFVLVAISLNLTSCTSAPIDPKEALKKDRAEGLANGTISLPLARTLAVVDGDIDLARKIITVESVDTGCDNYMEKNQSCLESSIAFEDNIEMSKMLIVEKHANVNIKNKQTGQASIHWACGGMGAKDHGYKQHVDFCQLVLDHGADINSLDSFGHTALMLAARNGFTETVKLLISKGADLSYKQIKSGRTALDLANQFEHEETYQVIKAASDLAKSAHR